MKQSKYNIINKILIMTLFLPLLFIYSCDDDPVGPEKGTIKGQIIDYLTNEPLEGCLVFTEPGTESVFSDAKGNFTISNATPGEYSIKSAKVNYKTSITKISIRNNNTTISNLWMFVGVGTVNLDSIVINQAPKRPTANYPVDESKVGISLSAELELSWNCTDPENDEMTYKVFLGQSSDKLNIIKDEVYEKKYKLKEVEINKTYYWQIEAKDEFGNKTKGPIFSFETQNLPPTEPVALYPTNNVKLKIDNIKSLNLIWSCNDPENGILKYNVYFSDNLVSIPKIASDIKNSSYKVDNIEIQKTYFWKIEAVDDLGQKTMSQVFSFDIDTVGTTIDYNTPILKDSLLVYLGFNGNTNNYISDYSAINSGVGFTNDRKNNPNSAGSFNLITNKLYFQNLNANNFESYTVSFWIKPNNGYGQPYENLVTVVGKAFSTGNSTFSININSASKKLTVVHYDLTQYYTTFSNSYIYENVWTHVTITFNKLDKKLKMYINNNKDYDNTFVGVGKSTVPLHIGMDANNNNRVFNGVLDDLYIFNKALNSTEVSLLYNK